MKQINSGYAMLDVKGTKKELEDFTRKAKFDRGGVKVMIRGTMTGEASNFDGASIEYAIDVTYAAHGDIYIQAGDVEYDRTGSNDLRSEVIKLRDACLGPDKFDATGSVVLSHVVAWMAGMMDNVFGPAEP